MKLTRIGNGEANKLNGIYINLKMTGGSTLKSFEINIMWKRYKSSELTSMQSGL